jgi:hypothetical protein
LFSAPTQRGCDNAIQIVKRAELRMNESARTIQVKFRLVLIQGPYLSTFEKSVFQYGSVVEWSMALVLKTRGSKGSVSSNLTASAK